MTRDERESFELELYLETKNHRGCISDAADFLRHPDSSKISKIINPNDPSRNNIFAEVIDVLEGFNHKHPGLTKYIWTKMTLEVNSFIDFSGDGIGELGDLADSAAREQLDVIKAIGKGKSYDEIEKAAFEALETSRKQYEQVRKLRNESTKTSSKEK